MAELIKLYKITIIFRKMIKLNFYKITLVDNSDFGFGDGTTHQTKHPLKLVNYFSECLVQVWKILNVLNKIVTSKTTKKLTRVCINTLCKRIEQVTGFKKIRK